ncbi:hypothetical protein G7067_01965 [Leucobacter insecticola]|uniref:Uncharacterized protein n=1 Tax=Leucobacter insecticola TaxID=2714934 RepID=A0A6G8FGQ2_9MICO|nr:hypothetical protein [Leucobacter insecticola]QIM15453.1 hypothetical protein G7067_01965 [Leucobacter insecticola]
MALKHRVVQRFDAGDRVPEATFELARAALQGWLDTRREAPRLPTDLGARLVAIGGDFRASFQRLELDDSHVARWRVLAGKAPHTYLSTITVLVSKGGGDNWLWYDVESGRDDSHFSPPKLTLRLTKALKAEPRDRISGFTEGLRVVRIGDLGQFLDEVIEAEDRVVPALISGGTSWTAQDEDHVEKSFEPLYGLATFWKLDPEAFTEFNSLVRPGYRVYPGSVHSYHFGLDTNDDLDARRHWWFSAAEVRQSSSKDLSRRLHLEAMRSGAQIALPKALQTLNEEFERAESRRALEFFDVVMSKRKAEKATPPLPPLTTTLLRVDEGESSESVEDSPSRYSVHPEEIEHIVEQAATDFGVRISRNTPLGERLKSVFQAARRRLSEVVNSQQQKQAIENVSRQLESLVDAKTELERENDELNELLAVQDEEAREVGEILRQQRDAAAREAQRASHYANELAKLSALQTSEVDWDLPNDSYADDLLAIAVPETVHDLFEQIESLEHVSFTGDRKAASTITDAKLRDLILRDAWTIACELERYARQFGNEDGVQGLGKYIQERSISVTPAQFAADESSSVKSRKKFSAPRCFPVPEEVQEGGLVFMGTHFRLTQDNGKAMRMHIHDATPLNGRLYIGYIGVHLPSRLTS